MDLVKELNEQLTCPICTDMIRNAKLLKCGHTFCDECIDPAIEIAQRREDWQTNGIACPCCRLPTLPGELLQKNWMVDNIISVIDSFQNNAASNSCGHHPMNQKNYYCGQCEMLVCSDCVIEDHYDHRKRPRSLDEMTEITSMKIEALMERCREREALHDDFQRSLNDIWSEGSQVLETLVTDVTKEYEAKQRQLDEEKNRLLDDIAAKKSRLRSSLDEVMSVDKEVTTRLTQARIEATNRLSKGSKAAIVTSYNDWAKKLKKDLNIEIQGTSDQETELQDLKTLYFEKSECSPTIGEIQRLESHPDDSALVSADNGDGGDGDGDGVGDDDDDWLVNSDDYFDYYSTMSQRVRCRHLR